MTGHGNVHFSDVEIRNLRRYLEQGGFFHADDNYGMDKAFRREIARVFPDHPMVEVPLTHPITTWSTPSRGAFPRSTSTMVSPRRASAFFGRPACRILFLSVGSRGRMGGFDGAS